MQNRATHCCSAAHHAPGRHQGFYLTSGRLQNALTTATEKKNYVREVDGQAFYTYEVVGTVRHLCAWPHR